MEEGEISYAYRSFLLIAGVIVCFILYCFFEERSKKRAEMKEIEENARRKREEEERLKKVEERYSNSSILKQAVDKIVDITPRPLCVRVDSVCIEVYKSRVPELRRYANESSSVEDMPMLGDSWASMRFDHSEKYATKTLYSIVILMWKVFLKKTLLRPAELLRLP